MGLAAVGLRFGLSASFGTSITRGRSGFLLSCTDLVRRCRFCVRTVIFLGMIGESRDGDDTVRLGLDFDLGEFEHGLPFLSFRGLALDLGKRDTNESLVVLPSTIV
mmetsp:Transcript_26000/g.52084  ORF Transcript_26000/g.52084 Transcript_26000/m.52084 type:complete len:106 (-) Transcript_26000:18-335(-)